MEKEIPPLNLDEYLAYVLLYAANADFRIGHDEMVLIRQRLDHDDFLRIRKAFEAENEYGRLNVIMHYKDVYVHHLIEPDAFERKMNELFAAGGSYPSAEMAVKTFLMRLLK